MPLSTLAGNRASRWWSLPVNRQPELMDDPALPGPEHLEALEALRQINAMSFTAASLAAAVAEISRGHAPLTVVDVACGGGDVTLDVARRLARHMQPDCGLKMVGVDISPRAVERARTVAASRGVEAEFLVHDVVALGCPPCDVAISSLFLHHLDDDDARALLTRMATAARYGIVVSDLVRSRLGLALAMLGTTLLVRSKVARVDGPMSVRAARTLDEYDELLATAGLTGATVRRVWPERVLLTWSRPEPMEAVTP
jgi:2-polyprenyl-3-methyl-5-hydroxy-6-metoxy-1,4-benzoquinol methylase